MAAMSGSDERDNVVRLPRHRSQGILHQWPITLVLAGVALAMILIALDSFRRGSVVLSASVLLAAFLRLLLPEGDAGLLAVRSKKIDVITLGLLGLGVTVFTFWVPPPS
ncbi:MAG: DUF3017 domain-containing protein [Candidatus Nanopelagicales bacterium]|nr:DUF3017 domain-containing protein [Candidatus Nanopelagicales bacterium]